MTTSQSPQQGDQHRPTTDAGPRHSVPQNPYPYGRVPQQSYGAPQQYGGGPQQYGGAPQQPYGAPQNPAPQNQARQNPAHQNAVPQQWAPPAGTGPQPPAGWGPAPVAAPRNGLGIAALCLGIIGILFGMVPFTGFIAFALGAVGLILGLVGLGRARRKVASNLKTAVSGAVLSAIAIALGIWGMVILFTGLNQLAEDLGSIPTASAPTVPGSDTSTDTSTVPADVTTPVTPGATSYKLDITGDAEKMMVGYGTGNATSTSTEYEGLPWSKTVESTGDYAVASVTATSVGPGSITCTITDVATGRVVDTETARSPDDNQFSTAFVTCSTFG